MPHWTEMGYFVKVQVAIISPLASSCSKSIMKTPEQCVRYYVQMNATGIESTTTQFVNEHSTTEPNWPKLNFSSLTFRQLLSLDSF